MERYDITVSSETDISYENLWDGSHSGFFCKIGEFIIRDRNLFILHSERIQEIFCMDTVGADGKSIDSNHRLFLNNDKKRKFRIFIPSLRSVVICTRWSPIEIYHGDIFLEKIRIVLKHCSNFLECLRMWKYEEIGLATREYPEQCTRIWCHRKIPSKCLTHTSCDHERSCLKGKKRISYIGICKCPEWHALIRKYPSSLRSRMHKDDMREIWIVVTKWRENFSIFREKPCWNSTSARVWEIRAIYHDVSLRVDVSRALCHSWVIENLKSTSRIDRKIFRLLLEWDFLFPERTCREKKGNENEKIFFHRENNYRIASATTSTTHLSSGSGRIISSVGFWI